LSKSVYVLAGDISIPYGSIKSRTGSPDAPLVSGISIPYGSIKRNQHQTASGRIRHISIPYGSIKRFLEHDIVIESKVFQFLMVQLKASTVRKLISLREISIPYGSIKRNRFCSPCPLQAAISIPYGSIKRK